MEKPFEESWFHAPLHAIGDRAWLDEAEARHLQKVLRVRPGRRIIASNGEGGVFLCDTRFGDGSVEVEAAELFRQEPEPPKVHLVLGLLKGRDSEDPVEGLCQLPIAAIHLVITDHCQEPGGRDYGRLMERLRAKSQVALKQAKKPWLTAVHFPRSLKEWRKDFTGPIVLVHPGPDRLDRIGSGAYFVLTGPEGGFSEAELDWLLGQENADVLGLGSTRIRGAHAPLLACGKLMGMGRL